MLASDWLRHTRWCHRDYFQCWVALSDITALSLACPAGSGAAEASDNTLLGDFIEEYLGFLTNQLLIENLRHQQSQWTSDCSVLLSWERQWMTACPNLTFALSSFVPKVDNRTSSRQWAQAHNYPAMGNKHAAGWTFTLKWIQWMFSTLILYQKESLEMVFMIFGQMSVPITDQCSDKVSYNNEAVLQLVKN